MNAGLRWARQNWGLVAALTMAAALIAIGVMTGSHDAAHTLLLPEPSDSPPAEPLQSQSIALLQEIEKIGTTMFDVGFIFGLLLEIQSFKPMVGWREWPARRRVIVVALRGLNVLLMATLYGAGAAWGIVWLGIKMHLG